MKRFEGEVCGRCERESVTKRNQLNTKVKEIADPFYDEANPRPYENLVFNINKALQQQKEDIVKQLRMEKKPHEELMMNRHIDYNSAVDNFNSKLDNL
jgi:hypothetical protein